MEFCRLCSMQFLVAALLLVFSQPLLYGASTARRPLFTDYPVRESFHGRPKPVDLNSHPDAREYRTRLRQAATGKPSFAAYYIVAEWGCGSPCQQVALIDARTGAVHFAPFSTSLGNRHRLNSRLFIADAPEDISAYYEGRIPEDPIFSTTYWLWDETKKQFRPLSQDSSTRKSRTPHKTK
ncbi:MAG: hypothetical protein WCO84_10030 [bacterium]